MANNKSGLKEVLLFVSIICLIFSFIVSEMITSSDLFLKIFYIVLLVILAGGGVVSTIKSLMCSVTTEYSTPMIILNASLLIIYLMLVVKIIYTV